MSGHGFGHASRVVEVVNELTAGATPVPVTLRTSANPPLLDRTLRRAVAYEPVECDTGAVQIDSLHLDEARTMARAVAFHAHARSWVARESAWLAQSGATLVVADTPPLASVAAAEAGVPGLLLGNFTWDWIYELYAGQAPTNRAMIDLLSRAYARATLALRLPMCGGFESVDRIEDVPFIARHSSQDPGDIRDALGVGPGRPLVLVSFGGYEVARLDPHALDAHDDYEILITGREEGILPGPLGDASAGRRLGGHEPPAPDLAALRHAVNLQSGVRTVDLTKMYGAGVRYEDLVRAADVVVTKPGYGIVAECVANQTAVLYTSRGHFREYDLFVDLMPRLLTCRFIGHDDLFAGRWRAHLDRLLAQPGPPEQPATDGAVVVAARLREIARGAAPPGRAAT